MKRYFSDKVTIVTGGGSGIGQELCMELGRLGAVVTVADINSDGAKQVAEAIVGAGGRARGVTLDVTDAEEVQRIVKEIAVSHGRLDFMFNNAGITLAGEVRDMNLDHWHRIIDVNLLGVIYGTTAAYSLMLKQGSGHIVNIASYLGLVGLPFSTAYNTSKFAVVGLSTSLRHEAAGLGVRVSVVCPGYILTRLIDDGTMLKVSADDIKELLPVKMYSVVKTVRRILKGVARNRAVIVFPLHARLFWLLNRAHQSLLIPIFRKAIRDFRSLREDQ
jgi:NAD(P)-dependent dehydrogenase (short-subunit alcohol dehydrogenase family)